MTDSKSAWNDAGSKLSDLGRKLKQHYDEESGGPEGQAEVKDALSRLGGAVQDVFDALGRAAKDPDVKTDVKQVGQSLTTALGATFSDVSEDLRRAFGSAPPSPSGQPGTTGTTTAAEPASTGSETPGAPTTEPAATAPPADAAPTPEPPAAADPPAAAVGPEDSADGGSTTSTEG